MSRDRHRSARTRSTPRTILFQRWVLALGLVLIAIHAVLDLTWRFRHSLRSELRPLFVVYDESSVLTWLTIGVSALFGLLCWEAARIEGRRGWYGVGLLFLFLSMDDATMFHERVSWIVEGKVGEGLVYRWVQVLGPIFGVLGLLAIGFLWRRFHGDPQARLRILLAFAAMGMALVFEGFERFFQLEQITLRGFGLERYTIPIEEYLELLGPALLVGAVGQRLELRLGAPGDPEHEGSGGSAPPWSDSDAA